MTKIDMTIEISLFDEHEYKKTLDEFIFDHDNSKI